MIARGIKSAREFLKFTSPSIDHELGILPDYSRISEFDPEKMAPLGKAAKIINQIVRAKKNIVIVSDYDADGNCSAAIMSRAIWAIGGKCSVIQPDRVLDGYGLTNSILEKVQSLKPDLVITLDLGTNNKTQIEKLKKAGTHTIVVDHHELHPDNTAEPDVMINPKSDISWQGYQELAASGLSWLLARSLLGYLNWVADSKSVENELLTLAAIGTVADVMKITDLNRAIVHEGLSRIKESKIPALNVLSRFHQDKDINSEYIGFLIGPLLNAAGRIAPGTDSQPGTSVTLDFLLANSEQKALEHFSELEKWGRKRKELEAEGLELAKAKILEYKKNNQLIHAGIVVAVENIHEGVVGLVAARICENMQCPAIVLTKDNNGNWKGSGRAPENVNLMQILNCDELVNIIDRYGGHAAAAGVGIKYEKLQAFKTVFERLCHEAYGIVDPAENPFSKTPTRNNPLPKIESWAKEYQPDLIMSVDQYVLRQSEIAECRKLVEPSGRGNPPLRTLLFRTKIVSKQLTAGGHLRLVLAEGPNPKVDWKSGNRLEAIVFKRSIAHRVLEHAGPEELFDLVVQSAFDKQKSFQKFGGTQTVNIAMAEPTAFTYAEETTKKQKRLSPTSNNLQSATQTELFDQHTLPEWQSIQEFKNHFNITCLTDKLEYRPEQIRFVAEQMLNDKIHDNQNLVYRVNTGGGKTIIAFIKAAQIISNNPDAKVLYLVPQHDLIEQAIDSAKEIFNIPQDQIVELSGQIDAVKRKASYKGTGKLFFATPQTIENDADLSMFNLVVIDEVQYMHGDNNTDPITKYAYRWIVQQVKELKDKGNSILIWAQSGTPASSKQKLKELLQTLEARWASAKLPTGAHEWKALNVHLPDDYRMQMLSISECYKQCLLEIKAIIPAWTSNQLREGELSLAHAEFGSSIRNFFAAHDSPDNRVFPARSKLLEERKALLNVTDKLEKELVLNWSGLVSTDWIWQLRSRLTELELTSRLFDELKTKGRLSLSRSICRNMLQTLYPKDTKQNVSSGRYNVRAFSRPHFRAVIDWALKEPTAVQIATEFRRIYPAIYSSTSPNIFFGKPKNTAIDWQKLFAVEVSEKPSKQKIEDLINNQLDKKLKVEMLTGSFNVDPKEFELIEFIKKLPEEAKIILMCEKKFEAEIMAGRLNNQDIKAAWYAGKSVSKSAGLRANLEMFRKGDIQVLCATSAADTGHDIAGVTHIIRISALSSPIKNAQTRGRVARQKGLMGEYLSMIVRDMNPDFDESVKMYRAKSRLRAMEKIST